MSESRRFTSVLDILKDHEKESTNTNNFHHTNLNRENSTSLDSFVTRSTRSEGSTTSPPTVVASMNAQRARRLSPAETPSPPVMIRTSTTTATNTITRRGRRAGKSMTIIRSTSKCKIAREPNAPIKRQT
eukprot:UN23813